MTVPRRGGLADETRLDGDRARPCQFSPVSVDRALTHTCRGTSPSSGPLLLPGRRWIRMGSCFEDPSRRRRGRYPGLLVEALTDAPAYQTFGPRC